MDRDGKTDHIPQILQSRQVLFATVDTNTDSQQQSEAQISAYELASEGASCKNDRDAANFQLAIYIALAHAGLVLAMCICYGVGLMLKDYWSPIQWAILISMPLHEVQEVVVCFWERPLQLGLAETIFAIPLAMLYALLETARDVYKAFQRLSGSNTATSAGRVTFSKLFQWLLSFGTFTLSYEYLGLLYIVIWIGLALSLFWSFNGVISVVTAAFQTRSSPVPERRGSAQRLYDFTVPPIARATRWSNQGVTQSLLKNLPYLVALGLIFLMILVVLGGTLLFSYKVGIEAKDAVIVLKARMQRSQSGPGLRISHWLDDHDNSTYAYIDTHMMVAYDTVVQKVDEYAAKHNMTDMANAAKEFLNAIAYEGTEIGNEHETTTFWNKLKTISIFLRDKSKRGELLDIVKKLLKSGGGFMTGSLSIMLVLGLSVANLIRQGVLFIFVLFFIITSESGRVMNQVLDMVPLSNVAKQKCATVLDRTISAIFLTTGKIMFFQATFTYLLFRFLKIHFLYMSTTIALVQGLMPIFPNWAASIPALLQLLAERKYLGVLIILLYKYVMDFGFIQIRGVLSNYNQYLTGISIAGGMTLFTPALSGIIMGPLLMTVLIATRDLYYEFVLKYVANYQQI